MARSKSTPLEDVIVVASKLPWWAGAGLALVSYLILHGIASRPPLTMTGPGQMGDFATTAFIRTLAMFGQFLLPFAFGLGALVSALNQAKDKKIFNAVAKRPDLGALNEMSWSDFERLVSEYYRRKGFQVSRKGGNGPDGGIDLVLSRQSETYLVQCKQWKAYKVGVQPVREFYGVMASRGVAGGYFVTSGEYTGDAKAFARGLNLELIDGRKLREMINLAQQPVLSRVKAGPVVSPVAQHAPLVAVPSVAPVVKPVVPPTPVAAPVTPACPQCAADMVQRVARSGNNARKEFWGCIGFPNCKGTRQMEEPATDRIPAMAAPEPDQAEPVPKQRNCPECGTDLVLRKFMSGPRNGEEFYGCLPCKKGWSIGQVG